VASPASRSLALLVLLALSLPAACSKPPSEAPSLSPKELETRLAASDAPAVIDVRTPAEYASGHVPGAVNIPYEEIATRIGEVEAPNGVALYCGRGPRARKGEESLFASGYGKPVFHLEGGFTAWQADGLPVEHTP